MSWSIPIPKQTHTRLILDFIVDGYLPIVRTIEASVLDMERKMLEQQRQGTITRQMASWAAILAVPTAIAGIYGMNFENMPELKTSYGYFVVLGVILTLCLLLYIRFKRTKWL